MTGIMGFNANSSPSEMAAPQRRAGERSEPARSGGAAISVPAAAGVPDPEVRPRAARRRFTAAYKLRMVEQAERAQAPGELGQLLRREGLYSSHLTAWRRLRASGALGALSAKRGRKPSRDPLAEEIRKLRAQNQRLEKKLEQAAAIIDVQKKLSVLLGITLPETATIGDGE